jgi:hypothetical protein
MPVFCIGNYSFFADSGIFYLLCMANGRNFKNSHQERIEPEVYQKPGR